MRKDILLLLLKDFSAMHSITSMAKQLGSSRVGVWKAIKKLEEKRYIKVESVGSGKTSASIIRINWDSSIVEKTLALYLTEEAEKQKRWMANFAGLEDVTAFTILFGSILHSTKEANDIDIIGVAEKTDFTKIQKTIDSSQKTQSKKIHSINFTKSEFKQELEKPNKAIIEAVRKGVVLFGQENFVEFIKEMEHGH